MKIELYKIEKDPTTFDVGGRISHIEERPLGDRNFQRGADFIRLEALERRGPLWLCDFVRLRMNHGPSKAGLEQPAQGFGLGDDEGFGEETAFLWDSRNDWCVVQYNHHGVRPNAIADYLGMFIHDAHARLDLMPKIDAGIHAKLRAKKLVTKLSFSVAPQRLSNDDYDCGGGLGAAAKQLSTSDAERVEITISAPARRGLNVRLSDFADWIRQLGGASKGSPVTSAHATARGDLGDKPEVLDILRHRIVTEARMVPGTDRRFSCKDRWDALCRAHENWQNLMI